MYIWHGRKVIRFYKYWEMNYLSLKTFHYPSLFISFANSPQSSALLNMNGRACTWTDAFRAASIQHYRSCLTMILETFADANFVRALVGIRLDFCCVTLGAGSRPAVGCERVRGWCLVSGYVVLKLSVRLYSLYYIAVLYLLWYMLF
jgi:hypothetical protein